MPNLLSLGIWGIGAVCADWRCMSYVSVFKLSAFVDGSIGASICRLDGQVVLAVCFLESGGCGALGWRRVTTIDCQLLFATWGLHTKPGEAISHSSSYLRATAKYTFPSFFSTLRYSG